MGEKIKVSMDMDDLTFGELEEFENATGLVMSEAVKSVIVRDKDGRPVPDPDDEKGRPLKEVRMSAKAMMGMVYLAIRRQNPETTFEDVRRLKMNDVEFDVQESGDEEGNSDTPE